MSMKSAIQDVIDGFRNYEFWLTFGMNDVKAKYRRSRLGQLWITLSVVLFIFSISLVYGNLLGDNIKYYLAYVAIGYIAWSFIFDCLTTGGNTLMTSIPFLEQEAWPASTFIFRDIYREVLILGHHFAIVPIILLIFGPVPSISAVFTSIIGFLLLLWGTFWSAMLLSIINLRYRDVPPIVLSVLRLVFFISPILWLQKEMGKYVDIFVNINPVTHYLNLIRNPILDMPVTASSWWIAIGFDLFVCLLALFVLSKTKSKLSYWL